MFEDGIEQERDNGLYEGLDREFNTNDTMDQFGVQFLSDGDNVYAIPGPDLKWISCTEEEEYLGERYYVNKNDLAFLRKLNGDVNWFDVIKENKERWWIKVEYDEYAAAKAKHLKTSFDNNSRIDQPYYTSTGDNPVIFDQAVQNDIKRIGQGAFNWECGYDEKLDKFTLPVIGYMPFSLRHRPAWLSLIDGKVRRASLFCLIRRTAKKAKNNPARLQQVFSRYLKRYYENKDNDTLKDWLTYQQRTYLFNMFNELRHSDK
jgi:hypothetical protein